MSNYFINEFGGGNYFGRWCYES